MKKTRLVAVAMTFVMLVTIIRINVVNAAGAQNLTNEDIKTLQSINFDDMNSSLNVGINLADNQFDTSDEVLQYILSKNNETKKSGINKTEKNNDKKKNSKKKKSKKLLGTYKITGYCACVQCCGKSNGITASGKVAKAGRTIAADTNKLPFGTKVVINGHTYTVEDRGGAIKGDKIDIFFDSHNDALQWGVRYCKVYVQK